jgi:PAS domain S-box-containing protein
MEKSHDMRPASENRVRLAPKARTLVDQAIDPIVILNNDGLILYGNGAAQALLKIPAPFIPPLHFFRYIEADSNFSADWEHLLDIANQRCHGVQGEWKLSIPPPSDFEWAQHPRDPHDRSPQGSLIEVEYRIIANIAENQHLVALRDVTARNQADQQFLELTHYVRPTPTGPDHDEGAIALPIPIRPSSEMPELDASSQPAVDQQDGSHRPDVTQIKEERCTSVVAAQTELICRFLPDGTLTFVNDAYCRYFEKSVDELIGDSFLSLIADESQASIRHMLETLTTLTPDRPRLINEYSVVNPDGTMGWQEWQETAIFDTDGHIVEFQGVGRDVTQQKQTELALERSQHQYQSLINSVDGVVWNVDFETFVFTFVSPQAEQLLGYPTDAWLNHPTFWQDHIHPDDREYAIHVCTTESQLGRNHTFDYRMIRADGSAIWVRDIVNVTTENGVPISLQGLLIDITDEKSREEQLRHYKRIVSATPDAIALLDSEYRYIVTNQAYFTWHGYHEHELAGRSIAELYSPEMFDDRLKPQLDEALAGNIVRFQEWIDFQHVGRQFISFTYAPYFEADGTVAGVVILARDITGLKQAEISIHQQAEQERLLASMTHRIRQTLNLQSILDITVAEVRAYLNADRVLIYEFADDMTGAVIAESLAQGYPSIWGRVFSNHGFTRDGCYASYAQGRIHSISNIHEADLPACYVEMLKQFQVQANIAIPILQNNQLWGLLIAHHCLEPRDWRLDEIDFLQQLADSLAIAIQQSQLYEQTVLQARRESLLNEIVYTIRNSLNLNDILQQTTQKVLRAFQVNYAMVALCSGEDEYFGDSRLAVAPGTAESAVAKVPIRHNPHAQAVLGQDLPIATDDVFADPLFEPMHELLNTFGIQSLMAVSIRAEGQVKGILSVQQCDRQRHWTEMDQALLKRVADQLAIAVQQAELYDQVQTLNTTLEQQVSDRTADLKQALAFEALLKRITDRVRDSLDETQILQTAVNELALGLDVDCCDTQLFNEEKTVATVICESTSCWSSAVGTAIALKRFPYTEVIEKQHAQFCVVDELYRVGPDCPTVLSVPIFDDQDTLGDIWLFRPSDKVFSDLEVRLVKQVANQCAIAIRQARLFESAQDQVAELERLNRLKDDFLSTISHELRTPMASIKMALQMFEIYLNRANLLDDERSPLGSYFQILKKECDRETTLINNLLDLTHLDDTDQPLVQSAIQLNLWVAHIAEVFLEQTRKQQQHLSIHIPEITVHTDLSYLGRILTELLTNACKYTPEGESITLSADAHHVPIESDDGVRHVEYVRLRISNSGVELLPEECDRIFEKFYRVPNNDPWKYSGAGMGLALAKKLATAIGATIWAESSRNEVHLTLELPTHNVQP